MDGERRDCPIVPDNSIRYHYGAEEDDYLLIAGSHDSICIFPDSRYNHLRYYDADEGDMRTVWLPAEALADLHDMGVPHTKRESITECEYQAYVTYLGKLSASTELELEVQEPLAIGAGDLIDAEVQKAHEHLDAELDYYLKEWGE